MAHTNPQASFEDAIFGPNGLHPTPKALPYPKRRLRTIYGETTEYLIPSEDKTKILCLLYPFGVAPSVRDFMKDCHAGRQFRVGDYKVIEQNGYVMLVSPFFAESGASVIDWEPLAEEDDDGFFVKRVLDTALAGAFSAGYADAFTERGEGASKPARAPETDDARAAEIDDAYAEGYDLGCREHWSNETETSYRTMNIKGRTLPRRPRSVSAARPR